MYNYNPFGRGGGGAPLKDSNGNIIVNRKNFVKEPRQSDHNSRNQLSDNNNPYNNFPQSNDKNFLYNFNFKSKDQDKNSLFSNPFPENNNDENNKRLIKEIDSKQIEHQKRLLEQIEDNKRRREYERQKRLEEDQIEEEKIKQHFDKMSEMKKKEEEYRLRGVNKMNQMSIAQLNENSYNKGISSIHASEKNNNNFFNLDTNYYNKNILPNSQLKEISHVNNPHIPQINSYPKEHYIPHNPNFLNPINHNQIPTSYFMSPVHNEIEMDNNNINAINHIENPLKIYNHSENMENNSEMNVESQIYYKNNLNYNEVKNEDNTVQQEAYSTNLLSKEKDNKPNTIDNLIYKQLNLLKSEVGKYTVELNQYISNLRNDIIETSKIKKESEQELKKIKDEIENKRRWDIRYENKLNEILEKHAPHNNTHIPIHEVHPLYMKNKNINVYKQLEYKSQLVNFKRVDDNSHQLKRQRSNHLTKAAESVLSRIESNKNKILDSETKYSRINSPSKSNLDTKFSFYNNNNVLSNENNQFERLDLNIKNEELNKLFNKYD